MGLLGLLRRRRLAGADRPHRLVRDDQPLVRADGVADRFDLEPKDELGLAGLAFLAGLADAGDHAEAVLERGDRAARDGLVRLAEELAALGVADDGALTPSSRSMGAETSPVNAPSRAQ